MIKWLTELFLQGISHRVVGHRMVHSKETRCVSPPFYNKKDGLKV